MAAVRSVLTLGVALLVAAAAAGADVAAVKECVQANMPKRSTVQELSLSVQEDGDESFHARLTLYWRKLSDGERRILLRFREPEDLARASLLVSSKSTRRPRVHIYLPDQGKPRRVSSRGELESFLGRANLGIDEMELLLDPLAGADLELVQDSADLGGRTVWVLEEREAEDDDGRFARRVTFVDQEFCIPLRAEFYGRDNVKKKVLEVDPASITRVVDSWIPKHLVFRDLLHHSDTVVRVEQAEVDTHFSPALLTVEALPRLSR